MSADRGTGSNTTSFIYCHETLRGSPLRVSFVLSVIGIKTVWISKRFILYAVKEPLGSVNCMWLNYFQK